jgi:RND superfamily putative drug exporter
MAVFVMLGIAIDSNMAIIVSMGFGVGIDAGIYLLFRFREEYQLSRDFSSALVKSFTTSGLAVFFSFSALVLGCWSVIPLPIYIGHVGFGLGAILFLDLVFTITLLPALWAKFKPAVLFPRKLSD